ncbi:hypothetical protein D3C78_930790 [compost metagenome]
MADHAAQKGVDFLALVLAQLDAARQRFAEGQAAEQLEQRGFRLRRFLGAGGQVMGEQHRAALRIAVAETAGAGEQAEAVEEHGEERMQQHRAGRVHRTRCDLDGRFRRLGRFRCKCCGRGRQHGRRRRQGGHGDAVVQHDVEADHFAQLRRAQAAGQRADHPGQRGDQ